MNNPGAADFGDGANFGLVLAKGDLDFRDFDCNNSFRAFGSGTTNDGVFERLDAY